MKEEQKAEKAENKIQSKATQKEEKTSHNNKQLRGKKYRSVLSGFEAHRLYSIAEAIEKVKALSYTKFDGTVEMHARFVPKKKTDEVVLRGTINLPSGSPKERKVVVADDSVISKIAKGVIDFDILLAKPADMPKLAKLAKILGPKGKMPSPKNGTVTDNPAQTKKELSGGLVEYKSDPYGNLHIALGKVSWSNEKIKSNVEAVLGALPKKNLSSVWLAATMSPSVKVKID